MIWYLQCVFRYRITYIWWKYKGWLYNIFSKWSNYRMENFIVKENRQQYITFRLVARNLASRYLSDKLPTTFQIFACKILSRNVPSDILCSAQVYGHRGSYSLYRPRCAFVAYFTVSGFLATYVRRELLCQQQDPKYVENPSRWRISSRLETNEFPFPSDNTVINIRRTLLLNVLRSDDSRWLYYHNS